MFAPRRFESMSSIFAMPLGAFPLAQHISVTDALRMFAVFLVGMSER
jgi:hypothetical protein